MQAAILSRAVTALSPHGVFFVSYNTLPGWRQRGALRDILRVGASFVENEDDATRLENAMAFLALIVEQSSSITPYVREAAERLKTSEPSYIVQEFLGAYNTARMFTDFMRDVTAAGLQFVSESRVVMMSSGDLTPELNEVLTALDENIIAREQGRGRGKRPASSREARKAARSEMVAPQGAWICTNSPKPDTSSRETFSIYTVSYRLLSRWLRERCCHKRYPAFLKSASKPERRLMLSKYDIKC